MKKILLPLLILLLLTGCSKIDNKTKEYSTIVNNVLSKNNHNVNTASIGYKYYLPIGVDLIYDDEFNKKFKVKDTNIMLYVDIISYYYRNTLNYNKVNDNYYYFSKINNGYILVNELEDSYFLEIVYNYSKIEAYVEEKNLIDIINYSTIILNSITYNDTMIGNFIEESLTIGSEITYEIEKPENSESKFSQYLQEYVQDTVEEETDNNDVLPEK